MIVILEPSTVRYKNYTECEVEEILNDLKEKIKDNAFSISKREKNDKFIRTFRLNKKKIKEIILSLKNENFQYKTLNRNGLGIYNVFIIEVELINFHGTKERVAIYIKYLEKTEGRIPVVSFHEDE